MLRISNYIDCFTYKKYLYDTYNNYYYYVSCKDSGKNNQLVFL